MTAAGATRVVLLVKEDIGTEVADLRKDFWKGEVLLDSPMAFYKALGGGDVHKRYSLATFLAMIMNPFSSARAKRNINEAKKVNVPGNFVGEGFIHGGCYVLRADGTPAFCHLEDDLGDPAVLDEVVQAVAAASQGS
mmetsp:Transcript_93875/g.265184  ORF Transcript_93875/g.265184 Transcript_93875/m.265184 type:complete len:137 (+) Transcript_93875:257-667(+)